MIVRNIKYAMKKDHNVYIGRGDEQRPRSPLANPFWQRNRNDESERREVIEKYRVYLWKEMQAGNEKIWEALRSIRPTSILMCHCHPKPCHGHVIVKAWTWAYKQGLIPTRHANHDDKTLTTIAHGTETRQKDADHKTEMDAYATDAAQKALAAKMFPRRPVAPRIEDPLSPEEDALHRARLAQIDAELDAAFRARYAAA